VTSTTAHAKQH